jgi:hypothetical protein
LERNLNNSSSEATTFALRRGTSPSRYAGKVPAQVLQKLLRHSKIRARMDYYANIDDTAMEAVLGPRRNSSRNNCRKADQEAANLNDGNGCPDSPSS